MINIFKKRDTNPNKYKRDWCIQYRKYKWKENDWETVIMDNATFKEVLKKLKNIMNNDIYTEIRLIERDYF